MVNVSRDYFKYGRRGEKGYVYTATGKELVGLELVH